MSHEIIWEPKGVVKRFFGHVTTGDLFKAGTDLQGDERFDSLLYVINDFLGISGFSFIASDVEELSAIDNAASRTNIHLKLVVITTDTGIIAMANHYANSLFNIYPFRIFPTMAEGRDWLESFALS